MKTLYKCLVSSIVLCFAASSHPALAQEYPNKPITWVIAGTAGSVADVTSRLYGQLLAEKYGQQYVIDNKPGAGGIIGTAAVARAKPDGYTILNGGSSTFGIFTSLYKNLPYDPLKDFVPVHGLTESPMILVVRPASKIRTVGNLIEFAKANPGKLNYSITGLGTTSHIFMEMLQQAANVELTVVPYKGPSQQIPDLLRGEIEVMLDFSAVLKPFIERGELIPIGITGRGRLKHLPDIPTVEEQGYPGVWMTAWSSVMAPAGTPQPMIDKLADTFEKLLKEPSIQRFVADNGATPMIGLKKEVLRDFVAKEIERFRGVVEKANIKLN